MRVLVACEYSGTVRDAFIRAGHEAMSCDILPSESDLGPHYIGDVRDVLEDAALFDLMVAHPPCTYLTNAGARWLYEKGTRNPVPERWAGLEAGAEFFRMLWEAPIPRIAVENPTMMGHAKRLIGVGKPDQTVQPWQFGHMRLKGVGLWLRNLPPLVPTEVVYDRMMATTTYGERAEVHHMPPGPDRQKRRSMFFPGIADAMAAQWGALPALTQENVPS